MPIEAGLSARVALDVGEADTALAMRSGDVPVLATPRVVALCEEACCLAVAGQLGGSETTVGMRVQIDHVAPARVGTTVTVDASVERIEGRRVTFTVTANDERGLVAAGRITRKVVDRKRFLSRSEQ